jgi:hypothetical protein
LLLPFQLPLEVLKELSFYFFIANEHGSWMLQMFLSCHYDFFDLIMHVVVVKEKYPENE